MHDVVLIGSAAINARDDSILGRESIDRDVLAIPGVTSDLIAGCDVISGEGIMDVYEFPHDIATLDEVYTLKVSHSPWMITPRSWSKHIRDIHLLRQHGCEVIEDLYAPAYAQWEKRKGAKKVNLDQDTAEFFTSGVRREYVHDSLHETVKLSDVPGFTDILVPGKEVLTSKSRFFALSDQRRQQIICEEVMVLSLERDLIPMSHHRDVFTEDMHLSYLTQLRLLITQYSKGWFPRYIIENYGAVRIPPVDYWNVFCASDIPEPM